MKMPLLLFLSLALGGCASMRGVDVGTDTASTYALEVTNNRSGTVTISYTDGGTTRQLGTVAARQTERFVIAAPASTSVTVRATSAGGASVGTYNVQLQAGTTQRVTVR